MKILLTGYKGFIGKATDVALQDAGHSVDHIERDFTFDNINNAISNCDVVLHQGGLAETWGDPNRLMDYNYLSSKVIFDLSFESKKKVVFASSAAAYGEGNIPINIYGWSKYCAEQYGLCLFRYRIYSFISLRYFNVYGPGEEHKGKMASVAYQAYKNKTFKVFPRKPTRDFVHVADVASANVYATENNIKTGVYDVGSGESRLFEDVCELMKIPFQYHPDSAIPEKYQFYTCSDKYKWMPGWKPKYNLEQGLKNYIGYLNDEKSGSV